MPPLKCNWYIINRCNGQDLHCPCLNVSILSFPVTYLHCNVSFHPVPGRLNHANPLKSSNYCLPDQCKCSIRKGLSPSLFLCSSREEEKREVIIPFKWSIYYLCRRCIEGSIPRRLAMADSSYSGIKLL